MRTILKGAIVALAMAGAAVTVTPAAHAANVGISINAGDVAFGFSDGYWDRAHQWHPWANKADAAWYRSHYKSHYYAHRHDRDHEGGWREEWWH